MSPKRVALWFLIASVGVSALLGIIIVLAGNFSELEVRIIITTLTISATSICALAAGALWESGRRRPLALAGIILALSTAFIIITGIWVRTSNEEFWKFSASVSLLAVATAHACLISLATLAKSYAWARIASFVAGYALAGEIIYVIYGQPQSDTIVRLIGATSIVVAALTIVIPILHRLSRRDSDAATPALATQITTNITCPQCGSAQPNAAGEIECANCGCRFLITIIQAGPPPVTPAAN